MHAGGEVVGAHPGGAQPGQAGEHGERLVAGGVVLSPPGAPASHRAVQVDSGEVVPPPVRQARGRLFAGERPPQSLPGFDEFGADCAGAEAAVGDACPFGGERFGGAGALVGAGAALPGAKVVVETADQSGDASAAADPGGVLEGPAVAHVAAGQEVDPHVPAADLRREGGAQLDADVVPVEEGEGDGGVQGDLQRGEPLRD